LTDFRSSIPLTIHIIFFAGCEVNVIYLSYVSSTIGSTLISAAYM